MVCGQVLDRRRRGSGGVGFAVGDAQVGAYQGVAVDLVAEFAGE